MFDEAAQILEEIEPEDKSRNEVLGARVSLYIATRKWDMAAAIARHLVEVQPEKAGWWINLAYSMRRCETIEKAEAILLEAHIMHPGNIVIVVNLASYASLTGRTEEAKARLRRAIDLDKDARRMALEIQDLKPLWNWLTGLE